MYKEFWKIFVKNNCIFRIFCIIFSMNNFAFIYQNLQNIYFINMQDLFPMKNQYMLKTFIPKTINNVDLE